MWSQHCAGTVRQHRVQVTFFRAVVYRPNLNLPPESQNDLKFKVTKWQTIFTTVKSHDSTVQIRQPVVSIETIVALRWLPVPGHTLIVVFLWQMSAACSILPAHFDVSRERWLGAVLVTLFKMHSCTARTSACLLFPKQEVLAKTVAKSSALHYCGGIYSSNECVSRHVFFLHLVFTCCHYWGPSVQQTLTHSLALFTGTVWTTLMFVCLCIKRNWVCFHCLETILYL